MAEKELFNATNGARSDVPKIVFLLTDGKSRGYPVPVSNKLRKDGFKIIAIGITNNIDRKQLQTIGGGKVYEAKDWEELKSESFIKSLTKLVCEDLNASKRVEGSNFFLK